MPDSIISCSVLVSSCDAYSDLWTPFFTLFWRHWPNCPFPVYLGTNFAECKHPRVRTLHAGTDESWSANLSSFLARLQSEYVLLLLEDFFFTQRVNTQTIETYIAALDELGGATLRLRPNPPPDGRVPGYEPLGSVDARAPFRVSAQAGIWNRRDLQALLRSGESAWEFERNATERSRSRSGGFYCVRKPVIHYMHVVERGRWFRHAARRFGGAQIGCDFQARGIVPYGETMKKRMHSAMRAIANRAVVLRLQARRGGRLCRESLS